MPSPFPGMDPYLEDDALWPLFQHQLVSCLYQILLPGLVDRYRARVAQRCYATEQPLFTSILREQHAEEFIEVRQRTDNRLVTLIDVASPVNKTRPQGRAAYLESRKAARSQGASVVEVDLVLQGQPLLDYSREGLPEWDYAVTVTRSTQPERYEIYTATLPKRLPRFKHPARGRRPGHRAGPASDVRPVLRRRRRSPARSTTSATRPRSSTATTASSSATCSRRRSCAEFARLPRRRGARPRRSASPRGVTSVAPRRANP